MDAGDPCSFPWHRVPQRMRIWESSHCSYKSPSNMGLIAALLSLTGWDRNHLLAYLITALRYLWMEWDISVSDTIWGCTHFLVRVSIVWALVLQLYLNIHSLKRRATFNQAVRLPTVLLLWNIS